MGSRVWRKLGWVKQHFWILMTIALGFWKLYIFVEGGRRCIVFGFEI